MRALCTITIAIFIAGCSKQGPAPGVAAGSTPSLVEARKGFVTKITPGKSARDPVDEPPAKVFSKVKYESPAGALSAYLTPDPKDGKKHPAIIWITGGDCNSIGDVWSPAPPKDDQTAGAYRAAGIAMMFPSLRGGNDNPGRKEGFFGEVDDVIAAFDYLAKQPWIDPSRIYLGGHSTGGTLVLLVAECTDKFRAVFSFGPVDDVSGYPSEFTPFNTRDANEVRLRSPIHWLEQVKSPTYVIEGGDGNLESLETMSKATKNANLHFLRITRGDHFSILAPINKLIAGKLLADTGPKAEIGLTEADVIAGFQRR